MEKSGYLKSIVEKHLAEARRANTHPAKLAVLSGLLKDLFGVELIELIPGIEKKIRDKILGFRGSTDLFFQTVIFEIKVNLEKEIDDAKRKLKKYLQALLEAEPERRHIGIATDVIDFIAYAPIIENNQVVDIEEISSINIGKADIERIILWLDSFVFSKPRIRPTADDLKYRFGPGSPTYSLAVDILSDLWDKVKDEPSAKLKFDLWMKNMQIVYGSEPEAKAFIDQTYLVTLVKLIIYLKLSGDNTVKEERIRKALTGEYFTSYGILNLIEEDFFIWILHSKIADRALELACDLTKELLRYDMSQIDEDLFKEIYQEIVERGTRHRIGEYYTPEWLVELTLREAYSIWSERNKDKVAPKILDPACGSGTFLCNAIKLVENLLEKEGKLPAEILDFILNGIVGIDINPLAVVIARANCLIALGKLIQLGKGVVIPVYVADSIKLPEIESIYAFTAGKSLKVYQITVDKFKIQIPAEIAKNRVRLSIVLGGLREAVDVYELRRSRDESKSVFERSVSESVDEAELEVLRMTLRTILDLADKKLNEIWIFMLNNIYAPIALVESKFDILTGNPPWIAMRYIENKDYQDWLKQGVLSYGLLSSDQVELFTHMEIATLFFDRCAELYLKDEDSVIAFVMPRSVLTGAFQHANFKLFKRPKLKLSKILDLERVSPLFNVPSCVLIALKGGETVYPVLAREYIGKLERKNVKLSDATQHLKVRDYMYEPPLMPTKHSWYYDKVREGATIVPRSLWFVDFVPHPTLGIDVSRPLVKSSEHALKEAKEEWKSVKLERNIESNFIYATLLGGDILPFGHTELRSVVLPIVPSTTSYTLLDVDALRRRGFTSMADWLEKAQEFWEKNATERSLRNYPRVISWLNYLNKLTNQNPSKRYVVLYNASGTNLVSCVIDKSSLPDFQVLNARIKPKGFLSEAKTYFYETEDGREAHYLCAFLNSETINERVKPLQTKGSFGERDFHRRPFMLPIPKFNHNDPHHLRLAELSKICHQKVAILKFIKKSTAGSRKEAREAIKEELKEIDELVSKFLNL